MKRIFAWVLLAAVMLSFAACAKPDALAGTWNMVSSMQHKERAEEIKNGTYAASYTFDGHGKGTRTVLSDGKTTTGSFRYELIERGTTILSLTLSSTAMALIRLLYSVFLELNTSITAQKLQGESPHPAL